MTQVDDTAVLDGGEVRHVAIMFCDLVDSTPLSRTRDAEAYARILERYQETCRVIIGRDEVGSVDERHGDGVLACFGSRVSSEDNLSYGVRKAIEIIEAVDVLSGEVGTKLEVRVGVHGGVVYRTARGDVYGEAVNYCARIHAIAEPGTVVVSKDAFELVSNGFRCEPLPAITLKGFDGEHELYVVTEELSAEPRRGHRWSAPFVGRQAELRRALDAVANCGSLVVSGEAGVGKSRFVAELVGRLADEPTRRTAPPLQLVCFEYASATGLRPVQDALRRCAGLTRVQSEATERGLLHEHLDALGLKDPTTRAMLAVVAGVEPERDDERVKADPSLINAAILDAAQTWMEAQQPSPGTIVVEDLQWADASTLELVQRLCRSSPDLGVIQTSRSVHATCDDETDIELRALGSDECVEVVTVLDTEGVIDQSRRRTLIEHSDGVPLYLEELVHRELGGAGHPANGAAPTGMPSSVPLRLHDSLLVRIERSGVDQGVIRLGATIGRAFDPNLLAEALHLDEPQVTAAVNRMVDSGLAELVDDESFPVRFRHALMRDFVYELIPPSEQRILHGMVGEALRARATRGARIDWSLVALHFDRARRVDDAVRALDRAADGALERGSIVEARSFLGRAIELATDRDEPAVELPLRLKRGFLAVSSEGNAAPEAIDDYDRALRLCEGGDDLQEFVCLISLWGHRSARGDLAGAYEVAERLRKLVSVGYQDWEPENMAAFAILDFLAGRFTSSLDLLQRGVEALAPRSTDDRILRTWYMPNDPQAAMYTHLGATSWFTGRWSAAAHYLGLAADRARGLPFPQGPHSLAYTKSYETWLAIEAENFDQARVALRELSQVVDSYGFPYWATFAQFLDAYLRARLTASTGGGAGQSMQLLETDAAAMQGVIDLWEMFEARALVPWALLSLGEVLQAAGRRDDAVTALRRGLDISAETGIDQVAARTQGLLARLEDDVGLARRAHELAVDQGAAVHQLETALDVYEIEQGSDQVDRVRDAIEGLETGGRHPALQRAADVLARHGG